jgi:transposase
VLERRVAGQRPGRRRAPLPGLAEPFTDLIFGKVKATDGRITAKRLLPVARAAGYTGSARTFRRAVAAQKALWRKHRRVYRPWVPEPGQHLLIDYGTVTTGPNTGLKLFTGVLAWSRWRFVRFTRDESLETTLRLLAECFEALGGVPAVVLADRMGCLKGGVVANVVVPTAGYVRFATHYGFTPDFCEAADPESKGAVEALVRYAKSDLVVPADDFAGDLAAANMAAQAWCAEVNAAVHRTNLRGSQPLMGTVQAALDEPEPPLQRFQHLGRIGQRRLRSAPAQGCPVTVPLQPLALAASGLTFMYERPAPTVGHKAVARSIGPDDPLAGRDGKLTNPVAVDNHAFGPSLRDLEGILGDR